MSITLTFQSQTAEEALRDFRIIMDALVKGDPLPPMQEQPNREHREPVQQEVIDPPAKKTRARKDKEPVQIDIEQSIAEAPPLAAAPAEATDGPSSEPDASSPSAPAAAPDIETVRAKLKALGATDGLGHDAVFDLLGKYGAKNASTVPEDKRAEVIAKIDALMAEVA